MTRHYTIKCGALIAVLFLLEGCRTLEVSPGPDRYWNQPKWEKSSQQPDRVWISIRDQKIDASRPLTLYELGDIALHNNPATRQAWEDARIAAAKRDQAQSAWYPQLTGSGTFLKQKVDANAKANNIDKAQFKPAAEVDYLILDLGGRVARIKGADQILLAANFTFNQSIQDLLRDVGNAYYALYAAQSTIVAAKADVDNAMTALDAARKKFSAGLVSKLDVVQAEANYYSLSYSLEDAKGRVKAAKADLAAIMGLSADTAYVIVAPPKEVPMRVTDKEIRQIIDDALLKRPDIASARANVRAKQEAVKVADSDLWPNISYNGSVAKGTYRYFNAPKAWGDDYEYNFAQLTMTWAIFDGFDNYNKKVQAKAESGKAVEVLRQSQIAASADVWKKFYAYKTAIRKLYASTSYFTASKTSYDLALQGYDAGLKSMLDVLQAESDLSTARSKLIQSKKDLFTALVDLAHATGSLTTRRAGISAHEMNKI